MYLQSEASDFPQKSNKTTGNLLFGTAESLRMCPMNSTYIDVGVECVRSVTGSEASCRATRARHSKGYPISSLDLNFDTNKTGTTPGNLLESIPFILSSMHPSAASPLELWLTDPLNAGTSVGAIGTADITARYQSLPSTILDGRLTVLLNTVLRGSYRTDIIFGTDGTDPSRYTYNDQGSDDHFGNTTGHWSEYTQPAYRVHFIWLSLYLLSNTVLFLCAVCTIALRIRIRAPDFLNSISALTRDSPYIRIPPGGSTLDGTQMTKALGVKGDAEVGRIAFADATMVRERLLRKNRLYI